MFPWATKNVGAHPTFAELFERGVASVEGEVRCKHCNAGKTISYEITAKFEELSGFIVRNVDAMNDRMPSEWIYPALPDCDKCGQKNNLCLVIAPEHEWRINWMFLLLRQTLGLYMLGQLKNFYAVPGCTAPAPRIKRTSRERMTRLLLMNLRRHLWLE